MHRRLDEIEFTIFDTETTGLAPQDGDRIVEIAAMRFKPGQQIESFQELVNPGREISPAAFAVNKITPEMLTGAPSAGKVLPKFLDFIQGTCLCSYNAPFDLGFLDNELMLLGRDPIKELVVVDILKMARKLLPRMERYALWFVAEQLGISGTQKHRAFSDVELTYGVFNKLREVLLHKGITDFRNFSHLFAINAHLLESLDAQKISQIQEAIDLGVKLKIKYISSINAEVTERQIIPKLIKRERNRNYVVGYCLLRNDERSFSIDGILHLEIA